MSDNIFKLSSVPLIPQPTDGVCWYVSARMVYKWSVATNNPGMKNPANHTESKARFDGNGDWAACDNHFLAQYFNMISPEIAYEGFATGMEAYESLVSDLEWHGPIWAGGWKTWGPLAPHGHVVVICGAAETGAFIHDPEPVGVGSTRWLTWHALSAFIKGSNEANPSFLTAI